MNAVIGLAGALRINRGMAAAAVRAIAMQDDDHAWRCFRSPHPLHTVNTYNTRIASWRGQAAKVYWEAGYVEAAHRAGALPGSAPILDGWGCKRDPRMNRSEVF